MWKSSTKTIFFKAKKESNSQKSIFHHFPAPQPQRVSSDRWIQIEVFCSAVHYQNFFKMAGGSFLKENMYGASW